MQERLGCLMYAATSTRCDIAFPVHYLCKCLQRPTPELIRETDLILSYLARLPSAGLTYTREQMRLSGFSDASWETAASTSGWVVLCSLLNSIDWFFDAGDQRLTVRVELGVSSREVAVHDLAVNKAALQISSDQIDAAHAATLTRGVGEERACRGVAKGRRPSLVKVNARLQRVALHA